MTAKSWKILLSVLCLFAFATPYFWVNTRAFEEDNSNSYTTFLSAVLTGSPINNVPSRGHAVYSVDRFGGRRLSVEVSVNLSAGTQLAVFVGTNNIGQITLSPMRNGKLVLTGSSVPNIQPGSEITVKNGNTVVLSGTFSPPPSPQPSPPTVALFAPLAGQPIDNVISRGIAQYFEFSDGRKVLNVFVRQINLPSGTILNVFIEDNLVGQITLQSRQGVLRLDTANGDNVPTVTSGNNIKIKNGETTILSGTFRSAQPPCPRPAPSPNSPTPCSTPTPTPSPRPARFFSGRLNGNQVVPPVTTQGRGAVFVALNQAENQIRVSVVFARLSSQQTTASINGPALPGANAPVIFDLGSVGGTSGRITKTFDVTAEQVEQLRTGLWYVIIGTTSNPNGEIRGQIKSPSRPSGFTGEAESDIAVFRPSSGMWYISRNDGFETITLGQSNDIPVTGDYDGDGNTDAAVFRDGSWQIRRSYDGVLFRLQWGIRGDIPVPGDFDGDGRSDIAVFRPSSGVWYILNSDTNAFVAYQFGMNGDIPIAPDLDGDGRSDVTIFRPSNGTWYWLRSSDGRFSAIQFGRNGDVPVIADFDGDGIDENCVFRPSNGTWYWLRSSDGAFRAVQFGLFGDIPVASDFDGDTIADIAVFRPNGVWYIWRSSDNSLDVRYFGTSGDIPVINY